jgi:Mcm10 replication factor
MNFTNLKRPLVSTSETKTVPEKKSWKRPSTSTEMDDSDVSLSDDDGDELLKFSRASLVPSSKSDGAVSVPGQSSLFLKIAEQNEKRYQIEKDSLASSGRMHNSRALPKSENLHMSMPVRAVSSIGRIQQNQAPLIGTASAKSLPPKNSILSAASSPTRSIKTKDQRDLRLVGSVLLSTNSLQRNSSALSGSSGLKKSNLRTGNIVLDRIHFSGSQVNGVQTKVRSRPEKDDMIRLEKKKAEKAAESLEIQQLLGKKSSHAEEREGEWFEGFEQRTAKLVEKEEIRKKMSTVVNSFVRAYHCRDCKIVTESALAMQLCSDRKHSVSQVRGVKWYFECAVCQRKDSTLSTAPTASSAGRSTGRGDPNDNKKGMNSLPDTEIVSGMSSKQHPTRKCECGGFNWRSCSKYGSNEGKSIQAEQKVILSASEWTSRKDLASLDSIRSSVL